MKAKKHTRTTKKQPKPAGTCTAGCQNGNPWRGYLCACQHCKGAGHGQDTITLQHVASIVDRKLRAVHVERRLPLREYRAWVEVARIVHNQLARLDAGRRLRVA